jgi:hypothetical protein
MGVRLIRGAVARRLVQSLAAATAAVLLVGMLGVGSAAAEPVYVRLGSFGAAGSGQGELLGPHGLAVDAVSGDILVADTAGSRIDVYRPSAGGAEYLFDFGSGLLAEPLGIAVDQSDGDVYVADPGRGAILKFDPDDRAAPTSYAPDPAFAGPPQGSGEGEIASFGEVRGFGAPTGGLAVDPGSGELLVADPGRRLVERLGPEGSYLGAFDGSDSGQAFTAPAALAAAGAGEMLVADQIEGGERLLGFRPSGEFIGALGDGPLVGSAISGVAIARASDGSIFLASKPGFGSEPVAILHLDASGSPLPGLTDEGAAGFALGLAAGDLPAPRLYVDATASLFGTGSVAVFEAVEPPEATIAAPSEVGATEARFAGTVDPGGVQVGECAFQYTTAASFEAEGFATAPSVACEPPPGAGSSPEAVAATADGLEPNTAYRVRLRASGRGGAAGFSALASFTTAAAPPEPTSGAASSISDSGATLAGAVDPRNSALSGCRFEYGPSTAYGSSVPCAPAPISGGRPVAVDAELAGLAAATTYHYRLLVEGAVGGARPGADRSFETRTSAESALPARAYELVGAADTNGVEPLPLAASEDGERFVYATFLPAPGAASGLKSLFRATRSPDGSWSQSYVGTPAPPPGEDVGGNGGFLFSSRDLSVDAFATSQSLDPDDRDGAADAYLGRPGGSWTWLSRDPAVAGPQRQGGDVFSPVYISPDGARVLFESPRHLLAADRSGEGHASLYMWEGGRLSLLGLLPGQEIGPESGSELGSGAQRRDGTSYGAVSRDGSRVAFESEGEDFAEQLYLRLGGASTIQVSRSAPGVEPPIDSPRRVVFRGADATGGEVLFTSTSPLTADSQAGGGEGEADLYLYDVAAGSLRDLTPHLGGGGVERVYAVAEDGSRVYFTSTRSLLAGEGVPGEANLYLAEPGQGGSAGALRFIATIDPGEDSGSEGVDRPQAYREVAADRDGSVLAFRDRLALLPGRATGGRPQLYVYEAARGELSCASCPGGGREPAAGADLLPALPAGGQGEPSVDAVLNLIANTAAAHIVDVAADGAVFFQTAESLLPADTNGRIDVYEWHGGKLGLISAGAEAHDSIYGGASTDGRSVFFSSADALLPGLQDSVRHLYVARVGGGAPPAPTAQPPCEAADCRAPAAPGGAEPSVGTASLTAAAPAAAHRRKRRRHRPRRSARRHRARHARHHRRDARHRHRRPRRAGRHGAGR